MKLVCHPSSLRGAVDIPASKSHTIRAVAIASLANGISRIESPLLSADAEAAVRTYQALGAEINTQRDDCWTVTGFAGRPITPADEIDVANSGTTLRIAVGSAALLRDGRAGFTGDAQVRRRPIGPLIEALNNLGARGRTLRDNGCAPLVIEGHLRGGRTAIQVVTSQYLSSLLINCPLADGDSEIEVTLLNEAPYVHLTLHWLDRCGIRYEHEDLKRFRIPGGQVYGPIEGPVPADFSSATFFLAAGALGDNDVLVRGLDMNDPQGDKQVVDYLRQMGANVTVTDASIRVRGGALTGCELDLNNTPDALPMMAALACFAQGTTRLVNAPHARLKETDRIAVMAEELGKLGAQIEELSDGLVIHGSRLRGTDVSGHDDHRVVMALAVAASAIEGKTTIHTAEAMNVTFPTFVDCLLAVGGRAELSG